MVPQLCTRHASIDAAKARSLLEDAKDNSERLHEVYSDCFFDGSVAAAEAATLFALQRTDSTPKAVSLAETLKSLPTAVPLRTAMPLARLCTFLTFSFSEEVCRAPLNTFCYADAPVKRASYRAVFEMLRDTIEKSPGRLLEMLARVNVFFTEIMNDSEEIDRHIVVSRFIGLAHGMNSSIREELLHFILEIDASSSRHQSLVAENCDITDYDGFVAFELFGLATNDKLKALVVLRSLMHGLEYGDTGPLNILWTSYRPQIIAATPVIGGDIVLLLLMAIAARLACSGNISKCRPAVSIAEHLMRCSPIGLTSSHDVVRNVIVSFCASIGATSSSFKDDGVSRSIAAMLRSTRSCTTTSTTKEVRGRLLHALQGSQRWRCVRALSFIGLMLKLVELWSCPSQFVLWLPRLKEVLVRSSAVSSLEGEAGNITSETRFLSDGEPRSEECDFSDTYGALMALVTSAVLGHSVTLVRLRVVEALSFLKNGAVSLFYIPVILLHLQYERNGVVAVKIIRDLLCSHSLLQHKETSKIALQTCTKFFGHSSNKAGFNSSNYEVFVSTLGFGTEKVPGLATSLLLREIERLKEFFGLTKGPVRASASAAILKLVESRPTRGTNFIPFISQCITPESMEVAPEASSICFEVMNVMAEEEVLDAAKAVKIVMKNYPNVTAVDPKARRSYLRLLGTVSRNSSTKKGAVLASKVVRLLRTCLIGMKPRQVHQNHSSDELNGFLSWDEVGQAAHSLRNFTVEEILRIAHSADEVLLDLEAEAERKEVIEQECQDFIQNLLSLTTQAQGQHKKEADSLTQLLVRVVSYEWENRKRSSFDPDRIGKLRAASDALRRARRARGTIDGDHISGKDSFSRVVKGLPTGVVKGVLESCVGNHSDHSPNEAKETNCFAVAVRVLLAAKALSSAFPWVALVDEVMISPDCDTNDKGSCLAVLRAVEGNDFELKDAREVRFGPHSLINSSGLASHVEARELFLGMIHFYPSEAIHQLFKHKTKIPSETLLVFIRASSELNDQELITATEGLFPVVLHESLQDDMPIKEVIEGEFYETMLSRCPGRWTEDMLMKYITESAAVRIICMTQSFTLLCETARALLAQDDDERGPLETVGLTVNGLDAAHRREFVLEVCASTDDDGLREKQHWLAAHVYGVAAFLPYTDLALSVTECFSAAIDRDGVRRTIDSIRQ